MPATKPPPPTQQKIASSFWMFVWRSELHADGALAGYDVGIVKGRYVDEALLLARASCTRSLAASKSAPCSTTWPPRRATLRCLMLGVPCGITMVAGMRSRRGRVGHALRVVAGAARHHAPPALLRVQVRHLVVRAAQLEAEHGLLVLALEQHEIASSRREEARCRLRAGSQRRRRRLWL